MVVLPCAFAFHFSDSLAAFLTLTLSFSTSVSQSIVFSLSAAVDASLDLTRLTNSDICDFNASARRLASTLVCSSFLFSTMTAELDCFKSTTCFSRFPRRPLLCWSRSFSVEMISELLPFWARRARFSAMRISVSLRAAKYFWSALLFSAVITATRSSRAWKSITFLCASAIAFL
ncbi:hypothetical protein B0T18DRAFT_243702 [Schizothecium vesticola]|uniref:Uncharacterized protein n=1 Tax=Schizothecium vesticola TaxID=314040 RepID=A0AA40EII5_9PEZI|nr:hypothetical protein B0T18DRAFT_243702 [Schizothecium vesticola]